MCRWDVSIARDDNSQHSPPSGDNKRLIFNVSIGDCFPCLSNGLATTQSQRGRKCYEDKPKIVIIAGPTASGKTGIGINLAERFCGEIISADSVQIYRYMNIGSAKPTAEDRARVVHHMLDIRDPNENFSAGDYVREARECIKKIVGRGRLPIIVGGTGLYIRCLIGGMLNSSKTETEITSKIFERGRKEQRGSVQKTP